MDWKKRTAAGMMSLLMCMGVMPVYAEGDDDDSSVSDFETDTYAGISDTAEDTFTIGANMGATLNARPRSSQYSVLQGIDVSQHNCTTALIDWEAVKDSGVDFVFIRAGGRGYVNPAIYRDKYYTYNIEGALDAGLQVGIYFFSQAITADEAVEEADYLVSWAEGYDITLPLIMDYEWSVDAYGNVYRNNNGASVEERTEIAEAFMSEVTKKGYSAGLYASAYPLGSAMDGEGLAEKYWNWTACYGEQSSIAKYYGGVYDFWQYTSSGEVDGITGYVDMDYWFKGSETPSSVVTGTEPVYRLYNPNNGDHVYTTEKAEVNNLESLGWNYEGEEWDAPRTSSSPVYRLYNPNSGEHHYTTSKAERNHLDAVGWNYEGIAWYSDTGKSVKVYRIYNPNAYAFNHFYTTSASEKNRLVKLGWNYEGIAWYGA